MAENTVAINNAGTTEREQLETVIDMERLAILTQLDGARSVFVSMGWELCDASEDYSNLDKGIAAIDRAIHFVDKLAAQAHQLTGLLDNNGGNDD